jgi:hypothetical protein
MGVPGVEEARDKVPQVLDGTDTGAAQALAAQDREPDLHLIEPRAMGRQPLEGDRGALGGAPVQHGLLLLRAGVVHHQRPATVRVAGAQRAQAVTKLQIGLARIALGVVLHNVFILGSFAWGSFLPLTGFLLGYALFSWLLLARFYRSSARVDLGVSFLILDVVVWTVAIYYAGAEQSALFFILLMRAADQAHTSFRRALAFAHLPVLTYALMLLYISLVDHRAVAWPAALVQLTFLYGGSLYIALTTRTAERRRRQTRLSSNIGTKTLIAFGETI